MIAPLNMIIHATGRMKRISFVTGSIYLLTVPLTYLFLKMGYSPTTPFVVNIFITIAAGLHNLYLVKLYIPVEWGCISSFGYWIGCSDTTDS